MIQEALDRTPAEIGFRKRAVLDESPDTVNKTSLAVARAKKGDQEAVRFLYVSYSHNIYGYARAIVRDEHEAEDVTQHVFQKLITAVAKYDDAGAPFVAWLLRLAHNVAVDHLRANRLTPVEEVVDPLIATDADLTRAETLRQALAALPDKQRQVVMLYDVAGLSHGEIAERLDQTEGAVRALHHRARRKLQRELERLDFTPLTRTRHAVAA
jgi:RNA polymerase sigma-70 factor, ECF subfamily